MRILAAAAAFCLTSLAFTTGTRAESFSGFYAGLNAGYAFDTQHGSREIGPSDGPHSGAVDDAKLPPSAASAAKAMQSARDEAGKTR